jgi:hypothetical protein
MKHVTFIILGAVVLFLSCNKEEEITEQDVDNALREYEVEPRESVFSRLRGADAFIEKFQLTPEEIEIVGEWYAYSISESIKKEKGIGLSIGFLPNRVFIAYDDETIRDENGGFLDNLISYKLGYWKIEKGRLMIRFAYLYSRTDMQHIGEYNRKEKIETDYYPIWKPGLYEQAAVQKEKFYYSKIPRRIKEAYRIADEDFYRGRYVIQLSFDGKRPSLYEETKRWHTYLMNPDLDDEQYAYNLRVMFTLNDIQERSYDFEKNEFGLDFSKWE